jgi:CBS domain-containing membrane protein
MDQNEDPRVPGRTHTQETLFAFSFGTVSIALMGAIAYFAHAPFIFPSLGPTAFLIFHRPTASAACPRNAVAGHMIGALSGLAALAACGLLDAPSAFEAGVTLPRALAAGLSVGLTSGFMVLLRRGHPPAGATTLIVSLGLMTSWVQVATLLVGVVLLVGQGQIIHRLAGTRYPLWGPLAREAEQSSSGEKSAVL